MNDDATQPAPRDETPRRKYRDRQVFSTANMPEDIIEAVRKSEIDPRHNHLDDLIKDWKP